MKLKISVPDEECRVYTGVYKDSGANRFHLYKMNASNGWTNYKLVSAQQTRKRCFYLAWNGERLAKSSDSKILEESYKVVHAEVMAFLKGEI